VVKNTSGTPGAAQGIVKTTVVARVSTQADRTIPRQVSSDRTIPRLETDSVGHNAQEAGGRLDSGDCSRRRKHAGGPK
jgi:hypothetical protein